MSLDNDEMSDEKIRELKEQKPNRRSKEAWDAARVTWNTRGQLKDPRTHPIILAESLGTPEKIQEIVGLPHLVSSKQQPFQLIVTEPSAFAASTIVFSSRSRRITTHE